MKVRLYTEDETEEAADRTGERAVDHVIRSWELVRGALVADLLTAYNEHWADPDCGRNRLSPDEFLNKLRPLSIDYFGVDEGRVPAHYSVLFDDADIFGSHAILVSWDAPPANISMCASLAG